MSTEHIHHETLPGRMTAGHHRAQATEAATQLMSPALRRSSLAPARAREQKDEEEKDTGEDTTATLFGRTYSPFYVRAES